MNLFGEEEYKSKSQVPVFSQDEIIEQAVIDFKLRGYIFKDLTLFEMMQELNELTLKDDKECLFTNLGYDIADTYHKHRHFASAINMKAPYDSFGVDENIRKVLKMAIKYEGKLTYRKYSFFNMVNGTQQCSNFRPGFAKFIYNKYAFENAKVLDTSTGYGGRLIGFLSSVAREYIGIDPNTTTYRANEKIKIDLGQHKKISLFNCPAEKWDNSSFLDYFDFAFTSPPYFKKEIYTKQETNSCNAYPEYENWIENFLKVMITKTFESLKTNSKYLLNIEDVKINGKTYPLVNDSIKIAKHIGFKHITNDKFGFRYSNKTLIENENAETIIIFSK